MAAIDLYPLLRNDDIWGQTVGTNWNMMACERHDCIFLSSSLLGMSAVFHCLSLSKVRGKVLPSHNYDGYDQYSLSKFNHAGWLALSTNAPLGEIAVYSHW